MAEKDASQRCTNTSNLLLDLPPEVLNQIILLLNVRERLPLGNSCQTLRTRVFEDAQLMRHLDFTKKSCLTTMTHIQQYFNNEKACQHIRRINAINVNCLEAGELLNNSIGRAINLVEVNIHGTRFNDIEQLGSFLIPLQQLEKLSIDWPIQVRDDLSLCRRIFQVPFSRLTYLSVKLETSSLKMLACSLSLCQQLIELTMQTLRCGETEICRDSWNSEIKQLKNLKIVQCCGHAAGSIKDKLAIVLPDSERWTDFDRCRHKDQCSDGFYIEKDVEVCDQLLRSENLQDFLNTPPWNKEFNLKWVLKPQFLLKEVLRITHQAVPEDLCLETSEGGTRPLLMVEEAKLLLKNPKYQISYLYMDHQIERASDTHLLASAFPNLSELVVHKVTRNLETLPKDSHYQKRLSRRGSPVPEKQDGSPNLDSSFKLLVENTPNLKQFTLGDHLGYMDRLIDNDWDLDGLHLISGWQNLETLHVRNVACEDGQVLIEIGKRCKNLHKFSLLDVWFGTATNNKIALSGMLEYCRNLRDLTIKCSGVDQAELFASCAKNVELERIEVINDRTEQSVASLAPWISSLENMIRQCSKLTTIICDAIFKSQRDCDMAVAAVERMKAEFRRHEFEIRVTFRMPINLTWFNLIRGRAFIPAVRD